VHLVGERGIGKTWLLRHLATDGGDISCLAVYLDLEQRAEFSRPQHYVAAMQKRIDRRARESRAILLLDSVPTDLDENLRALEEMVLRPQLLQEGAMVIMAPVNPARDCWRTAALRGGARIELSLFEVAQTGEQLSRLRLAGLATRQWKTSALQDYSGGLPLLNHLLACSGPGPAYGYLLDYVLAQVPADQRRAVRGYLEALCVLEVLEQAKMERALRVYYQLKGWQSIDGNPSPELRATGAAVLVRHQLQRHCLARSVPGAPGRVHLVDSVRRATREVLKQQDPDLYAATNAAAHGSREGRSR
jgi:hypothetical protein